MQNSEFETIRCVGFGREICGDLASAEQREWLVTNGIGGFASGTVAGLPTRRYHAPRGCVAQAWTVGELIRCWRELERAAARESAGSRSRLQDSQPAVRGEAEPVV